MESPEPREVRVRLIPAVGFRLEFPGALHHPFVTEDDLSEHYEQVLADAARLELFIPDCAPLVIIATEPDEATRRIEVPPAPT